MGINTVDSNHWLSSRQATVWIEEELSRRRETYPDRPDSGTFQTLRSVRRPGSCGRIPSPQEVLHWFKVFKGFPLRRRLFLAWHESTTNTHRYSFCRVDGVGWVFTRETIEYMNQYVGQPPHKAKPVAR